MPKRIELDLTKEQLRTLFLTMSKKDIAKKYNCSSGLIAKHLKKFGITKNSVRPVLTKELLIDLYITKNFSKKELVSLLHWSEAQIEKKLKFYNINKSGDLKWSCIKRLNQEKYGTDFPFQNKEFLAKTRETCLKNNGVLYPLQDKKIHQKTLDNQNTDKKRETFKQVCIEKYGVENTFQVKEFIEKSQQTRLLKYGTKHALQSPEILEKAKQTNITRYGDWSGANGTAPKEKCLAKNREKLGVDYPFQSRRIQDKIKETVRKKYGVDYVVHSPEVQKLIRKSILKNWGVKSHLALPEIIEKRKQTCLNKYGVPCSLQSAASLEKSYETRKKNESFKTSKAEQRVAQLIKKWVGEDKVVQNIRSIIAPYELDIVIPEKKIAIEYNGLYWHSEAWINKNYHRKKLLRCKKAEYTLITIFEHEWKLRKLAVISRLKAILGVSKIRIGARKTELKVVDKNSKETKNFLNKYHVQGATNFKRAYQLWYDNTLVAVMTFNRHHRQNCTDIVLNRFCVRKDYSISGGASKLLKEARKEFPSIVSYSDNRWSDGNLYKNLGFSLVTSSKPDYFYISNKGVFSKQSLRKTKEEQKINKTEHKLRLSQGYLRVYDCGKKKWSLK